MNSEYLEKRLKSAGELMIVLESGIEYDLHPHDTEIDHDEGMIYTEGIKDGNYLELEIPVDVVEHSYIHREV